ncbi:MAG: tRNA (adenosine(37)-N6)-threonylcarbamoyltransferase complex ATPase subunit type 1 TsaE [bacterium]
MDIFSKNTKNTQEIARDFLVNIETNKNKATVVGLYGELGTGKTTFVQFVGKFLDVNKKIKSPTYVIMKKYNLKKSGFKYLFHLDAYRLKNEKELLHLGWDEIISNKEHLVFIEWPEKIIKAMPKKHHQINITHTKEGHRKFKIKNA